MTQDNITKNLKLLAIIALIIVILYTALQIGAYFMDLVTILGIAIILTYVLLIPVDFLEHLMEKGLNTISRSLGSKKERDPSKAIFAIILKLVPFIHKRIVSIFIVYISFFLIVIFILLQLVPPAISQVSDLARSIPSYAEDTINYISEKFPEVQIPGLPKDITRQNSKVTTTIPIIIHEISNDANIISDLKEETKTVENKANQIRKIDRDRLKDIVTATASKFQTDILGFLQNNAQNTLNNLLNLAAGTLTGIGYSLTILVLSFYFLMDGKKLITGINVLIPSKHIDRMLKLEKSIHESLLGFLKGQVFLGIGTGLFMLIVYILFDVKYSIFLAIFLAIAEIIPVIGSSLGFIPAIIVMLFTGDLMTIPIVWLIFFLFQTLKDNVVAPKIVGEIIGLHPVTVIFALWIGFQVAGFFGILFAIPLASVINVIISFIITERTCIDGEVVSEN